MVKWLKYQWYLLWETEEQKADRELLAEFITIWERRIAQRNDPDYVDTDPVHQANGYIDEDGNNATVVWRTSEGLPDGVEHCDCHNQDGDRVMDQYGNPLELDSCHDLQELF